MEGLTDKQTAKPNKTFKEFSYEIFFFPISALNGSLKLFLFLIFGAKIYFKMGAFVFYYFAIFFSINPGHFGGVCDICKLRSWVQICIEMIFKLGNGLGMDFCL